LSRVQEAELLRALEAVFERQQQLWSASKDEALQALCEGFNQKIERFTRELLAKDATMSNVVRYFEDLVVDLSERSRRDPKTKLMNFDWFKERLESFLAAEQRVRGCAVGVVDITSFKGYNDTLGHTVGDRIIERVAAVLAEQIRSDDLLAQEGGGPRCDLHARFGGDEFCFLIHDLPDAEVARAIADRFKHAVQEFDWRQVDDRLASKPVRVDVGVVCLELGPVAERRGIARRLATELVALADHLMYSAKGAQAPNVLPVTVRIEGGGLVETGQPGDALGRAYGG
jgi:diguanylate cyclase (GGDEF)-like protein